MNCHDGHDFNELYHKLDFRCDCGNGQMMTATCKMNEDKDYTNDLNKYNDTFFDLYCYCKQPHDFELIDSFMVECY